MARKKIKKTYSPAEKRRKNRRFNTILYIIAALLAITGVVIIVSDQTLLFPTIKTKIEQTYIKLSTGEEPSHPTIPPFGMVTADPNNPEWHPHDPDHPYYWGEEYETVEPEEPTLAPGVTPDPNTTPRPTRVPVEATPRPTNVPGGYYEPGGPDVSGNPYAPVCIYFLNDYIAANITDIACPVDPVGYNQQGQMDTVHSAFRAGWFAYGGDPVHGGNVLIAGHNRYSGRMGYFAIIQQGRLQPSDIVIVEMANGDYAYYSVDSVTEYPYDAVPAEVMTVGGAPRLTLITCLGDYSSLIHTSRHRVIAVCSPLYYDGGNGGGTETEAPETDLPATSDPGSALPTNEPEYTEPPAETQQPGSNRE